MQHGQKKGKREKREKRREKKREKRREKKRREKKREKREKEKREGDPRIPARNTLSQEGGDLLSHIAVQYHRRARA